MTADSQHLKKRLESDNVKPIVIMSRLHDSEIEIRDPRSSHR